MSAAVDLWEELYAANVYALRPELQEPIKAAGLSLATRPPWGFANVEADGDYYQPAPEGRTCLITPAIEDGALIDLVATSFRSKNSKTRTGTAPALGLAWVDIARENSEAVRLFENPIEWLANGCEGVVLLDWKAAPFVFADVLGVACSTDRLARQLDNAFRMPMHLPRLFVKEAHRAAA